MADVSVVFEDVDSWPASMDWKTTDDRLTKVSSDLQAAIVSQQHRIEALENEKKSETDNYRGFFGHIRKLVRSPVAQSMAGALFGFVTAWFGTRELEVRKPELSQLTAMHDLRVTLASPTTSLPEAEASAVQMAAFGQPAIVPLINELQAEGQNRPLAALAGLRAMAIKERDATCKYLLRALRSEFGLLEWRTQKSIIRLLGDLGYVDAQDDLLKYRSLLQNRKILFSSPEPDFEAISSIEESLSNAMAEISKFSEAQAGWR